MNRPERRTHSITRHVRLETFLHHGRQPEKNDAADAEAIAEAAGRPTMRFVAVKSEAQQAKAMAFRTRDLLVGQRTQLINALRGHLAEHGLIAPQGSAHVKVLADALEEAGSRQTVCPKSFRGLNSKTASSKFKSPPDDGRHQLLGISHCQCSKLDMAYLG